MNFSTAKRYKNRHVFWLGLEPLSRFLVYLTFGFLIGLNIFTIFVLIAFGVRLISQLVIMKIAMNRLKEKGFLFGLFVFDIFALFINFNIYLSGVFIRRKKIRWK